MSWELTTVTYPKARKEYHCDASRILIDSLGLNKKEYSPEDWAVIETMRLRRFKILAGEKYFKLSGKWEGEFSIFRAIPEIDEICKKYDLYEE